MFIWELVVREKLPVTVTFFCLAFLKDVDKHVALQGPSKDRRCVSLSCTGFKLKGSGLSGQKIQEARKPISPVI